MEFVFFGALTPVGALFDFKELTDMGEKMSNYGQTTNPDAENINKEELFKRALSEGLAAKIEKAEEEIKDMEMPTATKRHKIKTGHR